MAVAFDTLAQAEVSHTTTLVGWRAAPSPRCPAWVYCGSRSADRTDPVVTRTAELRGIEISERVPPLITADESTLAQVVIKRFENVLGNEGAQRGISLLLHLQGDCSGVVPVVDGWAGSADSLYLVFPRFESTLRAVARGITSEPKAAVYAAVVFQLLVRRTSKHTARGAGAVLGVLSPRDSASPPPATHRSARWTACTTAPWSRTAT